MPISFSAKGYVSLTHISCFISLSVCWALTEHLVDVMHIFSGAQWPFECLLCVGYRSPEVHKVSCCAEGGSEAQRGQEPSLRVTVVEL